MRRSIATAVVTLGLTFGSVVAAAPVSAAPEPSAPYQVKPFTLKGSDDPDLAAAWKAWRKARSRHHAVVVRRSCYCDPETLRPVRTEVRGRRVVSVRKAGSPTELAHRGTTMDDLFRILRRAHRTADVVRVRYSGRGVPRRIFIDPDAYLGGDDTSAVSDDESRYTVRVRDIGGNAHH